MSRHRWISSLARVALLSTLALSGIGCGGAGRPGVVDPAADEGSLWVVLERQGCYGFCPVYWLRVAEDGALLYEGSHFVAEVGRRRGQLTPEQIEAVRAAFRVAAFFELEDSYDRPRYRDLPRIITTFRDGGRLKTVVHHLGDTSAPASLLELEEALDRILESEAWIGTDAARDRLSGA